MDAQGKEVFGSSEISLESSGCTQKILTYSALYDSRRAMVGSVEAPVNMFAA